MTVPELIEALQRLPGSNDLRTVRLRVVVRGLPFAEADRLVEATLREVIFGDVVRLEGTGFLE